MWKPPEPPENETERLAELRSYDILDTSPDDRFDRITRIASRFYGADLAFLSFIDADQQWMKSKTSDLLHDFIPRDSSVCTLVVSSGEEVVFDDLRAAPELEGHPLAGAAPWRFYASVPLRGEKGSVLGTLCVMRELPGTPPDFNIEILRDLAAISSHELTLSRSNAELRAQSNTDSLTGLNNRRFFDDEFARAWRRSRRTSAPATLLLLDLDHFKDVNDTLGHQAGDELLVAFAQFMKPFVRRPDDILARVGGEEFAIILASTDVSGGKLVADNILAALAEARLSHPTRGQLSVSIGLATLQDGEDTFAWWGRTDLALYAAKNAGRSIASIG